MKAMCVMSINKTTKEDYIKVIFGQNTNYKMPTPKPQYKK